MAYKLAQIFYVIIIGLLPCRVLAQQTVKPISPVIYTTSKINASTQPYQPYSKTIKPKVKPLAGECGPDTIVLHNQNEIDSFKSNYPGCHIFKNILIEGLGAAPAITNLDSLSGIEEVTEKLLVNNTNVTTLAGLTGLKRVSIWFEITNNPDLEETGLTNLESLGVIFFSNLPNLTTMAGLTDNFTNNGTFTIIINGTGLTSLEGLENIHTVPNMYISGNFELTTLQGLQNLTESGGGISINSNITLTDISALSGITHLDFGPLEVIVNYKLKDLTGLHNIIFIKKNLLIEWNIELETLELLNDNLIIEDEDADGLIIKDNGQLSFCSEPAICNFLSNGGTYEISGNATGCETNIQIEEACSTFCNNNGDNIIFTGDDNNYWDNANNWNLNRVPQSCDNVEIPEGKTVWLNGNIIIGSLTAISADIEGNEFSLHVQKGADLDNTNFYNFNSLIINGSEEIRIVYCNIDGNFKITKAKNAVAFLFNDVYENFEGNGNVDITDDTERINYIDVHGNYISGDLNLSINTTVSDAWTKIAEENDNDIRGSVYIKARNRGGEFRLGKLYQGRVNIRKNLTLDAEETNYPILAKVRFFGDEPSEIIKAGSAELEFEEIYFEKDWKELETTYNEDITITDRANFYNGLAKPLSGKKLIFERNAFVSVYSSGSWVSGTIRKIGSSSFNFPVGSDTHQGLIGMYPSVPISDDVAFDATYYPTNPTGSGYDTAQRDIDLPKVSGNEYWKLEQVAGGPVSEKQILLRYDSLYSQKTNSYFNLRISAWDGTEWVNKGVSEFIGNNAEAYVNSNTFSNDNTIFTLGYIPTRFPKVTVGPLPASICRTTSFKVPLDLDTVMVGGNTFRAELSDANGTFTTPVIIGQKTGVTQSDTIIATIPFNAILGGNYKIRITGLSPVLTSENAPAIIVKSIPQLPVKILGSAKVCLNSGAAKYYIETPEPGVNYVWSFFNGSATMTTNNDTAYITWTSAGTGRGVRVYSQNECGTGQEFNFTNIQVANPAPLSAPLLTNNGRWMYASLPAPPQPGLGIRWFRNGTLIGNATSYNYYAGLSGNYTAVYFSDCSDGPISNTIHFTANALPQTITFDPITDKMFGDLPFEINATASSGLPVQLTIISGPGAIIGNAYNITGLGNVTVRATQPGNNLYDTGQWVTRSFTINKASQLITLEPITDKAFGSSSFTISPIASSGLPCQVNVVSGPATISGNLVTVTGAGTVTIRAIQSGNANYNAATPIERSFCVTPGNVNGITGPVSTCPTQPVNYSTKAIPNAVYTWKIVGGSTLPFSGNTATVTWPSPGNYRLTVQAQGPCGEPTIPDTLNVVAITSLEPDSVNNMLPANGTMGLKLPLNLSWVPRHIGLQYFYDIYIWPSNEVQPATPFVSNITTVNYSIPVSSGLLPNQTYNWMVVAWNGSCTRIQTGLVQQFTLSPLADLEVTQVVAPVSMFSGQQMSIEWTVKNNGPAKTELNEAWTDAVFLSLDSMPFFQQVSVNPGAWSSLDFPVRPLLLATRPNVSGLDAGASYTNSINFTVPTNYNWPVYAYVITNYNRGPQAPLQSNYVNDTSRALNATNIVLSPAPDLRVDSVITGSPVFSGSTLNVRYKVKNYGANIGSANTAKWSDKIYVSKSPFFNKETATLLKQPKTNGTYYSMVFQYSNANPYDNRYENYAPDASYLKEGPLETDSAYTRDVQVVLPNFIVGPYYIFVVTDADGNIYEGPAESNNSAAHLISVILTPTPQLIVSDLQVPFITVSTTQSFGANWMIQNNGSFDNLQRNAGHYLVLSKQLCSAPHQTLVQAKDSADFGNSWWIDRVYLSTNPDELHIQTARLMHTFENGKRPDFNLDHVNLTSQIPGADGLCVPPTTIASQYHKNIDHVLKPGASFPGQALFNMPADLIPGTYYLYIATNTDSTLFEFPFSLKWKRSAPITVSRPDLSVAQVNIPVNATGGQAFNISYTLENTGAGSVYNGNRIDEIYVSTSPVFNASAQKLATLPFNESIASGSSVTKNFAYTFGPETAGTKYFFVRTNVDSAHIKETNYSNNIKSASLAYTPGIAGDLIVTQVMVPDSGFSVFGIPLKYAVSNIGSGTTYGTWTDSIFISCQAVFNRSSSFFAGMRSQTRSIANGNNYTDSFQLIFPLTYFINNCFSGVDVADAYFHVIANADSGTFETHRANNMATSGLRKVINPNVDHIITGINMPDEINTGRSFTGIWNVKNIGFNPGANYYNSWIESWYLVADTTLNTGRVMLGQTRETNVLNRNQSFTYQRQIPVPNVPGGEYYIQVKTNSENLIKAEQHLENNGQYVRNSDGRAKKIKVIAPIEADLSGTFGTYPATINAGQSFNLPFTITNHGPGPSSTSFWVNPVYVSTDFIFANAGDVFLGQHVSKTILAPGQSSNESLQVSIPLHIAPGNYILILQVNSSRNVYENNYENNLIYGYITINTPPVTDLTVTDVQSTDTALLGYPISVKWKIKNHANNSTTGFGTDGIYLSTDITTDSAVLQATVPHGFNISALGIDSFAHTPIIQGVTEGNYNLLVRTDILNNFNDIDRSNNTGARILPLYVDVKRMTLGITENNTLATRPLYYKLVVPDSLEGSTLLFTLKTPDALGAVNQVFAGHQFIPSAAKSDYAFETPNAGNQTMMMPSVKAGNYYILIQTSTPNRPAQAITAKIEVLPFAIVRVDANSGGNTGNVTIRISGSLYTSDMVAKLKGPATITATRIYFTNSNQVFATFNLLGAPLGIYDVELYKPANATTTILANGFRVENTNNGGLITGPGNNTGQKGSGNEPGCSPGAESGLNAQLVVNVVIPPNVFGGWPFVIQVNYTNPTNVDIPIQTRAIFSEQGLPVAFTAAALDAGATSNLLIELSETNGPPGFIRAGGSGTINIYSKAPADYPGHAIINYILK